MRRLAPFAALALAACATTPDRPPPAPAAVEPPAERGDLIGLDSNQLAARFGAPALTVREGDSVKLQYRGASCVLDAYLYRPQSGGGAARVTHVDVRDPQGRRSDPAGCVAALGRR